MTPNMLAELDEVVRLSEAATPGPWDVRRDDDELRIHAADTQSHGFTLEMRIASDINGYGKQRDDGSWDYSESEHNAQLIAKSVNFLRTHHATLADMAKRLEAAERKAARYDYLSRRIYVEDRDGGWSSSYVFLPIPRHDGSTYKGAMPYHFVTLDDAIDHAIDATQEGEG